MTLRESFGKTFGWAIPVMVACALVMSYVWYVDTAQMVGGDSADIMDIRPHNEGTVDYVIEKRKCVEHSGDDFPTGVIYQTRDGRAHYSTNPVVIGKALEEGLGGKDWPSHIVNIFCK